MMKLLYKWADQNKKNWKPTTLSEEQETIRTFWELEEFRERMRHGEIILAGVKLFQIDNLTE